MKNELRELIRNIIREELQKEDFDSSKGKDVGVHYDTIQHHANQLTNLLPKIKKYSKSSHKLLGQAIGNIEDVLNHMEKYVLDDIEG